MNSILFIHSSNDPHLNYFHLLAIRNKGTMVIYVHVFMETYVFISVRIELFDHKIILLNIWGNYLTVFQST